MKAIVFKDYGGPEQLEIVERPDPEPKEGMVVIAVKAFGINRAETYMRSGKWGDVARVSGIECVGAVIADPSDRLQPGQKVAALMGGMGRTIDGSYAERTRVPAGNVVPIETNLAWTKLAAVPESYATAWSCLTRNLGLKSGQSVLIRGATSALGQAALNIAVERGARVIATTRKSERVATLRDLGAAEVLIEDAALSVAVRKQHPAGVDAVLELVGTTTLLDSMKTVRPGGRICMAGFLGGRDGIANFDPLIHMPSDVHFSFFGSFMYGQPGFDLAEVPLQQIVAHVESGTYKAAPARAFRFHEIQQAHRLMEANEAGGKLVVMVD
jgi:NADPH:quinone reductase-like Zn-dependent oxidoreductase